LFNLILFYFNLTYFNLINLIYFNLVKSRIIVLWSHHERSSIVEYDTIL